MQDEVACKSYNVRTIHTLILKCVYALTQSKWQVAKGARLAQREVAMELRPHTLMRRKDKLYTLTGTRAQHTVVALLAA